MIILKIFRIILQNLQNRHRPVPSINSWILNLQMKLNF